MPINMRTQFNTHTLCVAHGVVEGCAWKPGLKADDESILLKQSWLTQYDFAIVGDVHYPQQLGPANNILVPGCPWYQHPHERCQDRGVWIVDIATGQTKLYPVPNTPRFMEVLMDERGVWEMEDSPAGKIVLLRPDRVGIEDWIIQETRDEFYEMGASYVEVLSPDAAEETNKTSTVRLSLDAIDSPSDVFKKVLRSGLVETRGECFDELERLGLELLKELHAD